MGDLSTSAAKVASVTISGFVSNGRGVLHRPQIGCRAGRSFSSGTRLRDPQEGQEIKRLSGIEEEVAFYSSGGF
jgi:hypothetical protein